MFTLLVKDLYSSYKDLPLSLYQIQTKYRDEARPRAGLLRGREFTMKDSYSFDVDDAGLDRSYAAHRDAYIKIFDRLGLEYVIVSAMSGAMGGSKSEEFLHPTAIGEDTFVRSPGRLRGQRGGGHAPSSRTTIPFDGLPEAHVEDTPDTPTIDTLVAVAQELFPDAGYTAASTLKNVVVLLVHPDGTREPLIIGIPGDRDVDLKRLEAQVAPAEVEPFADFDKHPALVKGYIGPQVLGADERLEDPLPGRPAGRARHPVDHRRQRAGQARVRPRRRPGLQLGRRRRGRRGAAPATRRPTARARWSSPAGWRSVTSSSWAASTPTPSASRCSTRTASSSRSRWAATASASRGPSRRSPSRRTTSSGWCGRARSRPPTCTSSPPARTRRSSRPRRRWPTELVAAGLTVLYDDRPKVSPGVKFKDAELLGMPTIVTVGRGPRRGHDRGARPGDRRAPGGPVDEAAAAVLAAVRGLTDSAARRRWRAVWHNERSNTASDGPLTVGDRVPGSAPAYPHTSLRRATETRSRSTPPTVATKIKLMRLGKMRAPYYRIVVADARTKRDGRSIETIGKYHPKEDPSFIEVDTERAQYWLGVGAQPTEAVTAIFRVTGDWQKFKGEAAPPPMKVAAPKPDKKAIYEEAVRTSGGEEPAAGATTAEEEGRSEEGCCRGSRRGAPAEETAAAEAAAAAPAEETAAPEAAAEAPAEKPAE